ncbi:MAG: hypothetical protein ABI919_11080 [Ramlibacter sp.]
MSTSPIAQIADAIQEALAGAPDLCATFTLSDRPDCWVQFVGGVANAVYPGTAEPAALLARLGSGTLQGWKAKEYLTVALALEDAQGIAQWIDRYFTEVLQASEEYALDVSVESL